MTEAEKGEKLIRIIENANVELKKIISAVMLMPDLNRVQAKNLMDMLINETRKNLEDIEADERVAENVILGLKESFLRQYALVVALYQRMQKNKEFTTAQKTYAKEKCMALQKADYVPALNQPINESSTPVLNKHLDLRTTEFHDDIGFVVNSKGVGRLDITNLRDFMTEYDEASEGYYVNYPERMRDEIQRVQIQVAQGTLTTGGQSVRAMAEMNVRYNLIQDDLERMGNTQYVVATQHSNASERCSWWQGKIFLVDIDVKTRTMHDYPGANAVRPLVRPIGTVDGKEYYSLATAIECGFLSYNCQHRLVKYETGMHIPKPLDPQMVLKRRNISEKQRYLERCIREAKTDEKVLFGEDRKKAIERSKKYQKEYADFCKANNVPRYDWRTMVSV